MWRWCSVCCSWKHQQQSLLCVFYNSVTYFRLLTAELYAAQLTHCVPPIKPDVFTWFLCFHRHAGCCSSPAQRSCGPSSSCRPHCGTGGGESCRVNCRSRVWMCCFRQVWPCGQWAQTNNWREWCRFGWKRGQVGWTCCWLRVNFGHSGEWQGAGWLSWCCEGLQDWCGQFCIRCASCCRQWLCCCPLCSHSPGWRCLRCHCLCRLPCSLT